MATVIGSAETPDGGYLQAVKLDDGTVVNVVTVFTGPGLAADTEIEATRDLTDEEQEDALDAAADHDAAAGPPLPDAARFPVVASF